MVRYREQGLSGQSIQTETMSKLNRTISPPRLNSTAGGGFMSFGYSDFRTLDMQKYTEQVRRQVNSLIRRHISNALSTAISETKNEIHYQSKGIYGQQPLEEVIGDSLLWHLKQGGNQYQSNFIIGSYDTTNGEIPGQDEPTGVRGSGMTKGDKSLIEIYDKRQGAFTMKGWIGDGSTSPIMTGYIGKNRYADWKKKEEHDEGVYISSGGYGKNEKRAGKSLAKVTHPGWKGMKTMEKLLRNAIKHMDNTSELEMGLSRMELPEQREGWHDSGTGTQQSLGAYSNLKGN